jgi:hypothetical protein
MFTMQIATGKYPCCRQEQENVHEEDSTLFTVQTGTSNCMLTMQTGTGNYSHTVQISTV